MRCESGGEPAVLPHGISHDAGEQAAGACDAQDFRQGTCIDVAGGKRAGGDGGIHSRMHLRSLGNLVHVLLALSQSQPDEVQVYRCVLSNCCTVGGVVASFKHILNVYRQVGPARQCASMNLCKSCAVRRQNNHRLNDQRTIASATGVHISLSQQLRICHREHHW